jgi:predicted nucleic acid-binding protein
LIALDSSFLVAFKIQNDVHHEKANLLMKEIASEKFGKPFLTDYIFDETVTGIFVRSKKLELAVQYGRELLDSIEMFSVEMEAFRDAWKMFSEQGKSRLSFTDATTISVMRLYDVKWVATFDRDFKHVEGIRTIGLDDVPKQV